MYGRIQADTHRLHKLIPHTVTQWRRQDFSLEGAVLRRRGGEASKATRGWGAGGGVARGEVWGGGCDPSPENF